MGQKLKLADMLTRGELYYFKEKKPNVLVSHHFWHLGQNLEIADILVRTLTRTLHLGRTLKMNTSKDLVKTIVRSAFGTGLNIVSFLIIIYN